MCRSAQRWEAAQPSPDMKLPLRNPYIPSDFHVRSPSSSEDAASSGNSACLCGTLSGGRRLRRAPSHARPSAQRQVFAFNWPSACCRRTPELLLDSPGLRAWHKLDAVFRVPKANAYFLLSSPAIYSSPAVRPWAKRLTRARVPALSCLPFPSPLSVSLRWAPADDQLGRSRTSFEGLLVS